MVTELQAGDPRSAGRFRLLGRLGAGGMGQVFLGRSAGSRLVAVKVIRPDLAGDPGFRARFAREVAAAQKVSGLFTALVVDADVDGPMPWLATAYVAGPSLAEAVEAHGPLPEASVLTLAAGLAEGLEAIHAAGVVHRDLKPSNVLLADDGPRVIDFGISRAAEASALTQSGTVMGSPGYMSPEQAEGREVGPPGDVFSLGAVLAFAAVGQGPFGTGSTPALMYRVVHGQPDTARLSGAVRPLVERCLAKDPGQRPTTAELLAELGAAQLSADWLPAPLTEVLSRYAPPPGTAGASSPPAEGAGWLPTVTSSAAPRPPAQTADESPAATSGRPHHGNRRRLTWIAVLAGLAAASVAAGVILSSAGGQAGATPPTRPPTTTPPTTRPPAPAVPDVVALKLADATAALKARGFGNIPYVYGCYRSPAINNVVRQDPGAGATVARTTPVRLYLQADNCDTVPDVTGMSLSDAAYTFKQAGFTNIPYVYQCYGSPHIGAVVRQSPKAGTSYGDTQPISLKLQAKNC